MWRAMRRRRAVTTFWWMGEQQVVGGTSAVAPLWAALITLINQMKGTPVGLVNPPLYTGMRRIFGTSRRGITGLFLRDRDGMRVRGWDRRTGRRSPGRWGEGNRDQGWESSARRKEGGGSPDGAFPIRDRKKSQVVLVTQLCVTRFWVMQWFFKFCCFDDYAKMRYAG